jgi:choline kinase
MKAVILAAGRGSRMKALTDSKPKCLVRIEGRTLLEWQLSALREAGIEEVGIVTGYRRELLSNQGLTEFHNSRWANSNMVSSLACASQWLSEESCIISYADIFYDLKAVSQLAECDADIAVTYDINWRGLWESRFEDPLTDAETFRIGPDGALTEIGNKAASLDEIEGQYMGLIRTTPRGWSEFSALLSTLSSAERDAMDMTRALQLILKNGKLQVVAVPFEGRWGEIDSAEDLALYDT